MPRFHFRRIHRIFRTMRYFKYTLRALTRFVFYVMLVKAFFCTLSRYMEMLLRSPSELYVCEVELGWEDTNEK